MSTNLPMLVDSLSPSGMTDSPQPKDKRVLVMMTADEVKAIDDWSFAHRIRSRGEAIRQLIAAQLAAQAKAKPPKKKPG